MLAPAPCQQNFTEQTLIPTSTPKSVLLEFWEDCVHKILLPSYVSQLSPHRTWWCKRNADNEDKQDCKANFYHICNEITCSGAREESSGRRQLWDSRRTFTICIKHRNTHSVKIQHSNTGPLPSLLTFSPLENKNTHRNWVHAKHMMSAAKRVLWRLLAWFSHVCFDDSLYATCARASHLRCPEANIHQWQALLLACPKFAFLFPCHQWQDGDLTIGEVCDAVVASSFKPSMLHFWTLFSVYTSWSQPCSCERLAATKPALEKLFFTSSTYMYSFVVERLATCFKIHNKRDVLPQNWGAPTGTSKRPEQLTPHIALSNKTNRHSTDVPG